MTQVDRSALVLHSAQEMFNLVNDVPSYPRFLPWCSGAEILEHADGVMVARLDVAKAGFKYSFTTRNRLCSGSMIDMELVDGPFTALSGTWSFTPLSEEACKVGLSLNFEFSGKLTGLAMGKVFNQIAVAMVDAFCAQADERYGS
ncbi:type II toxin-antitoxin system RatA family toxin [Motiliproteus sp. SC1-56]|uniref:type II toxin-antitoxin system RatA family toxin n=1 Tax=Motiliproteus sp. SC1-56 TaxID=2799565 RepID=UPI001A8CF836|nr:type II toxin-antitoxin system RatA family toxin [Motiliproteus sp. SC1-56]